MNSNKRLSLRHVRTFCTAAELGSFGAAGQQLFITTSAVSHQIKSLEAELQIQLFERRHRDVVLTEAGQQFFQQVHPHVVGIDEAASALFESQKRGLVRLSVQPFFANEALIPSLPKFSESHPNIDLKFVLNDASSSKHAMGVDVSIRLFQTPPDHLYWVKLRSLDLMPVASPRLIKTIRNAKTGEVSPFARLVHDFRPQAWKEWQRHTGIVLPKATSTHRFDAMNGIARAAEQGLGVALIPKCLCNQVFAQGSLAPLFQQTLDTSDGYYLVCKPETLMRPEVKAFVEWASSLFLR